MKIEYNLHGDIGKAALRLLCYADFFSTATLKNTFGKYYFSSVDSDITDMDCLTAQLDRVEFESNGAVSNALGKAGLYVTTENWQHLAMVIRLYALTKEV